jgi:hypothetical protein
LRVTGDSVFLEAGIDIYAYTVSMNATEAFAEAADVELRDAFQRQGVALKWVISEVVLILAMASMLSWRLKILESCSEKPFAKIREMAGEEEPEIFAAVRKILWGEPTIVPEAEAIQISRKPNNSNPILAEPPNQAPKYASQ